MYECLPCARASSNEALEIQDEKQTKRESINTPVNYTMCWRESVIEKGTKAQGGGAVLEGRQGA